MGAADIPHGTSGVRSELHRAQTPTVLDHSRTLPQGDGECRARCPHCGKASRRDHWNKSLRPRVQSPGALMPRTAISGLVCTTFLVLLGFPAVPQEPAGKGADTESGQLFACELRRGGHAARPSVQDRGPSVQDRGRGDVTQSLRWQELRRSSTDPEMIRLRPNLATPSLPAGITSKAAVRRNSGANRSDAGSARTRRRATAELR